MSAWGKTHDKAEQRKRAVKLTLPVFCGYIVLGIAFGATLAQGLPFDLTGIDFSMTGAVCRHLCRKSVGDEEPRGRWAIGAVCALAMLFLLGPSAFLAPALGPVGGSAVRDGYPKGGARMSRAIAVVAICAVVTIALRALPFVCFGGKKGVPRLVSALGETLPPAIMAALVVYCLKSVPFSTFGDGARQLIAAAAVVALHLWKKNTLLSIGVGTALYMLLIRI